MRKDVTNNTAVSFQELAEALRESGFDVDHFHGTEDVVYPDGVEEEVTHFDEFSPGVWENSRGLDEVSPIGWKKLVADEWHQ